MAFLGDFGKFFLGGATTADIGAGAGSFIGGKFGGTSGAVAGSALGRKIGGEIGNFGTADQPEQQSALPTPPPRRPADLGAQETQQSGTTTINLGTNQGMTQQAGFGNLLPLLSSAGRFLTSKGGQIATGVGTTAAFGAAQLMGSNGKMKPVLTQSRRNKSKVRQLVNFMGIEGTANFLSQSTGENVTPNDVVALLLRTFRNDGAFITKAQVRNLRRTTNRFKSLEKQVKEATSMTRTARRAPLRRASSTTLIKN
jgi:hypothetical protein